MSSKQLWTVIAGLILCNIITILFFAIRPIHSLQTMDQETQEVAAIGKAKIERKDWLKELESRYGKEVLQEMVDQEVIHQAANKYNVTVSKKDLNREMTLMKTMYGSYEPHHQNEENWKKQIKTNLLLEELLTKDAVVSEEELKKYYNDHKPSFDVPDTYHISHIVVKTEKDAKKVVSELKGGARFSTLAMEKSTDEFTANQGGDLGFITEQKDDSVPRKYLEAASGIKQKNWTQPIKIDNGYAILYLQEKISGKKYPFQEVKNQIRRQIALEQMKNGASPKMFWEELHVSWLYGHKK